MGVTIPGVSQFVHQEVRNGAYEDSWGELIQTIITQASESWGLSGPTSSLEKYNQANSFKTQDLLYGTARDTIVDHVHKGDDCCLSNIAGEITTRGEQPFHSLNQEMDQPIKELTVYSESGVLRGFIVTHTKASAVCGTSESTYDTRKWIPEAGERVQKVYIRVKAGDWGLCKVVNLMLLVFKPVGNLQWVPLVRAVYDSKFEKIEVEKPQASGSGNWSFHPFLGQVDGKEGIERLGDIWSKDVRA
ncbi:Fc.00g062130.m01.CDS01 [Cosmosporella sp. VM-42]